MEYPKALVAEVARRSEGLALEGFIAGQGPLEPRFMLVGEAPGRKEVENFIPFSGQAGKELMKAFAIAGVTREEVYITSSVRSRPFSRKERLNKKTGAQETVYPNRTPSRKEVLAHAPLLDYEIATIKPELLVTVGNIGLHRLLGNDYTVSQDHGRVIHHPIQQLNPQKDGYQWSEQSYTIIPTFHPAAVFYNRKLQPAIEADWQLIGEIIRQTNQTP